MEREYLSREPRQYTKKEKLANWFYYNKWYLAIGAVILYVLGSMILNMLGIGQVKPDYCVAYMSSRRLTPEMQKTLEEGLASFGRDLNGDGTVAVCVSQYIIAGGESMENATHDYAGEMGMLADITEGFSTFFLLEDPEQFQKHYQVLSHRDSTPPDQEDYSAMDKVYRWADCPALAALELGEYTESYLDITETGAFQDLLSNLYVGRRFFYDEKMEADPQANQAFWEAMTAGAAE
ncbi:MAG: hypothetical protein IJ960_04495 [Oscillospiraceae bacterium]|nr:hypothetical protein [Oscillospiraceae bacterium]